MPPKTPEQGTGRPAARRATAVSPAIDVEATQIVEAEGAGIRELASVLVEGSQNRAGRAGKVLLAIASKEPRLLGVVVMPLVQGLESKHKRAVKASAELLPKIAKVAPARVAKHAAALGEKFGSVPLEAQDGIVRTFVTLSLASVAYQRRLEPVLTEALRGADAKTLVAWTELIVPALKGEPHANVRAVAEGRLAGLPKPHAKKLSAVLGIKRGL